eukprot:gnl/TRDRNA2_/TRDRNA2_193986_c0_seq1.p1 gnl/TRDRNA2_/TRDRNA2_193986_c0~~gnl/TRDRNA2_/TRDRNA2_193986_c0_seq1.p1  ORF type:complete len:119 (-),score=3.27 gnl/TRDRNA2_/TRDRNA2_193986_c0_seq1:6-362(-)
MFSKCQGLLTRMPIHTTQISHAHMLVTLLHICTRKRQHATYTYKSLQRRCLLLGTSLKHDPPFDHQPIACDAALLHAIGRYGVQLMVPDGCKLPDGGAAKLLNPKNLRTISRYVAVIY